MAENQYFAKKPIKDCVNILLNKVVNWETGLTGSGLLDKIQRSHAYYYGSYNDDFYGLNDHTIAPTGDQGELLKFPVNHYRNIGQHMLNMITAQRPAMQARAINTDYKSLTQTTLANGLLDYYMREKGLENIMKRACEYSVVLSEGWVKMEWDGSAGEAYGYNEDTKTYVYEGDIKYSTLNPLQVVRDVYKSESDDDDWLIVRSYKNKYDLAAKYPELEKELLSIQTKETEYLFRFGSASGDDTDLIPVYEFYHKRTDAMPDGRYIFFASSDAVMVDLPMPYRFIPCFKISPSNYMGTPFGYTTMFDLMPIQEAINMLNSVILSNQNAFGVQNIILPKGADVNLTQLVGGLNIIEYTPGMEKPQALQLTATPGEVFSMLDKLEKTMETISGINQVTRGNPEASLRSGSALALIQAQAIQYASGLQQSYIHLLENIGTATVKMLQDFAQAPRVAAIVGKGNRAYLKEFTGDDLSNINRVVVDAVNPISKTNAGRLQMASDLLQYQMLKSPQDYISVMTTGNLDVAIQGQANEQMLIQGENERIAEGEMVDALAIDSHLEHIKHHKSILFDPDLRKDAMLVQNALAHIEQHIELLKTTSPELLQLLGETPLTPPMPPGQEGMAAGDQMAEVNAPPQTGVEEAQAIAAPSMPQVPADLLLNPEAQQASMGNVEGLPEE